MTSLIRRIALGQILPRRPGAQNPENTIEHFPRIPPRPPASIFPSVFPQQRLQHLPLAIGQIHRRVVAKNRSETLLYVHLICRRINLFLPILFMRWVLNTDHCCSLHTIMFERFQGMVGLLQRKDLSLRANRNLRRHAQEIMSILTRVVGHASDHTLVI
jgi:hypothetical protein